MNFLSLFVIEGILVGLKVGGMISWGWAWIFSPILALLAFSFAFFIIGSIGYVFERLHISEKTALEPASEKDVTIS